MSKWIKQLSESTISRRDFLKGSAAASASVAALSLLGMQNLAHAEGETAAEEPMAEEMAMDHSPIVDPEEGGKWISAACWHNCGGRCMNKVMIKDGMVIRQKTDDTHPDSFDYPQQRGCVRGKAQQQQCFGVDRIKYPMKRVHWSPEEPNGELRGKDEWERISWDEAIAYVADQIKTIKEKYGNEAFLVGSWGSVNAFPPLLAYGGHTSTTDSTSYGCYMQNTASTIGIANNDANSGNDRRDMLNADYIILHASNPAWSTPGTPPYHYLRAKEAGVKFITIDPIYTASAQMLDAYWIPVHTGTDTAFFLGVISEMLRLDEEKGDIIDWDFLDKYTVGFDADHKPADLKEDVNFRDYLEGKYDDVPKTAEWASNICGAPVEKITYLAEVLGKNNNVWLQHNYGAARNNGAENLPQVVMTAALMGGHVGKPGNCTSRSYHANSGNCGGSLVKAGGSGLSTGLSNEIPLIIPGPQVWEACFTGKFHSCGDFYYQGLEPGQDYEVDIHCIIHDENAYLQTGPNMKRGIEAHRKMDFVMSKAQFLTTQAKYSDIVLPVTTEWETPGGVTATNREFLFCYSQVTEPLFEAKTDQEINSLIMDALGIDSSEIYKISKKQQFFNQIAGSTVIADNGTDFEPLVTITQEDIDAWGVEGTPQEGRIGLQEFIDNGGYQVERSEDDSYGYIHYASFIEDPEANPLQTPSGKFEITCQAKADLLNSIGFFETDIKPYPHYIVPMVGYETTFVDGEIGGEKGEYPYLLFNPHYLRRSHSVFNNCPWLREAWPNPVFLNASDAEEKGIVNGDTVRIWTRFGEILRKACVMENMMPGQVGIPHGAWSNVDEETGIDMGGADNYLTGTLISAMGVTGYNNNNCNFEKYDGEPLEDDCYVDSRIIDLD